jgi:hypothetical protein
VIHRLRTTGRSLPRSCAAMSMRTVLVPTSIAARSLFRGCTRLPFRRKSLLLPSRCPDDAGAEQIGRCKEGCSNYKAYDPERDRIIVRGTRCEWATP